MLGNNAYGQCGRRIVPDEDYSKSNLVNHLSHVNGKRIVDVACGQDHRLDFYSNQSTGSHIRTV